MSITSEAFRQQARPSSQRLFCFAKGKWAAWVWQARPLPIPNPKEKVDIRKSILQEKSRGDCYRFLAACFYSPEKELFVQEDLFENLTTPLKQVCPDAAPFSKRMKDALLRYSSKDLLVEYARLFVGPYELKAPPYGSVYLDRERRVMGDSTVEVANMYHQEGLSLDDEFKELPDHISVELEFMYYLACKKVEALKKSDTREALRLTEARTLFLNKFLKPWVPLFCEKIRTGTDNAFYRALAGCLLAFVNSAQAFENLTKSRERKAMVV